MSQFQNESSCETIKMKMTDLHENGREGGTHFQMNGFARRLVSKERQRVTRKWPIAMHCYLKSAGAWLPVFTHEQVDAIRKDVLLASRENRLNMKRKIASLLNKQSLRKVQPYIELLGKVDFPVLASRVA